jgi:CRP-like cAMP-binding protein
MSRPEGEVKNWLLAALPDSEYGELRFVLEPVELETLQVLFEYDKPIEHVYFLEDCIASILSVMADGSAVETATVGREGMTGIPLFLGAERTQAQCFCQIPGRALRMPAAAFREAIARNGTLTTVLGRYTQALFALIAQNSACNRVHSVRERSARWLLMTQDRIDSDQFPLTQKFFSQMLGVRRTTVSEAAAALQREGLIDYTYGRITVKDRPGLEAAACECYSIIRIELDRLLANRLAPTPLGGMRFSEDGKSIVKGGSADDEEYAED